MKSLHVLVVDDEPSSRFGLEKLLRQSGFVHVVTAHSGLSALEAHRLQPADIVITDITMAGGDGLELCRTLHVQEPDLPVILVTANSSVGFALEGMLAGAQSYLTKPIEFDALEAAMHRAIATRVLQIEREQALRTAQTMCDEARAAVRARDETLAIVAHDLRSPLSIIRIQAKELSAHRDMTAELSMRVDGITRATLRIEALVRDLLEQARARAGAIPLELEEHSSDALLADTMELRPLALQKSIRLETLKLDSSRALRCDRQRVGQILSNLVGNAIKFTGKGGTILLSAEDLDEAVRFTVRDNGVGISPEACLHVFERYWQSNKNSAAGLGLGLFIAKRLVEAHQGRIWVESELGVGTAFRFEIPFTAAAVVEELATA